MMKLNELQRTCLAKMGIKWFEKRIVPSLDYLLCIEESMSEDKQQLLSRMLAALRWPSNRCTTLYASGSASTDFLLMIQEKSQAISPKKRIVFSDQTSLYDSINEKSSPLLTIVLPSLKTLLTDVQAKKEAWAKMQPLISF